MTSRTAKTYANAQFSPLKRAMKELSKNRGMGIQVAEQRIGLETDFTEQVARGIKEPTLEDVFKIANFFGTTMDSVLDGGHREIRVTNDEMDELAFQYFKECVKTYAVLLADKARNYWKPGLWEEEVNASKVTLEREERLYLERYKTHIEQYEREKNRVMDVDECCDEVLINELAKRGFKVERCEENGKKTN